MKDESIFRYYQPKNGYIGILSIPHSGEIIPTEFQKFLTDNKHSLSMDVDYKVDHLIDIERLSNAGIAVIVSNIHRTCVDLNRPEEVSILNWEKNSQGDLLVLNRPSGKEKILLESKYYIPYFEMLKSMINELHKERSKKISFIDLHSMPSIATDYHLKITPDQNTIRPDFCVSDIKGLSSDKDYIDGACLELKRFADNVTQNDPYFGGHITRYIHAQYQRINNIQIEISRALYMDETKRNLIDNKSSILKKNLTAALLNFYKANQ